MKKETVTILLITFCSYAQVITAQETNEIKKTPKRFSMGVQAMIMNSPTAASSKDIHELGIGVYARYFLGKHLALSLQANSTWAVRTRFSDNSGSGQIRRTGFDAPLQLEYHFSPESKVRPFFGAGVGVSSYNTARKPDYAVSEQKKYTQTSFLQLTYGMSFDIGKKMSLTTALFYRYNTEKQSTIGLSIGINRKR